MTQCDMTQSEWILSELQSGRKLSPMDAIEGKGCTKLSTRIGELKREGHPIKGKTAYGRNRQGKKCHYHVYWLEQPELNL